MILIILSIAILLVIIYNYWNYINKVVSKKNLIIKKYKYRSTIQYLSIAILLFLIVICFPTFSFKRTYYQIIYFSVLVIFCSTYIYLSRNIYCFEDHLIVGLNRTILFSKIEKVEFSDKKDKNKSTITFTTDKAFISITLSLDAKSELISHLYKKIPKRIYSL